MHGIPSPLPISPMPLLRMVRLNDSKNNGLVPHHGDPIFAILTDSGLKLDTALIGHETLHDKQISGTLLFTRRI